MIFVGGKPALAGRKMKTPRKSSRRKSSRSEQAPSVPQLPASNWLKDVCFAPISSAIAIAFVIFAAGSVMAVASVSNAELMPTGEVAVHHQSHTMVLGDSTSQPVIDDAALEAADPMATLSAKSVNFDSTIGRWNYNINYTVSNLTGSATLYIGSFTLQSGITASGQTSTGAILKPGMVYHVSLLGANSQVLARLDLKTSRGKTGSSDSSNAQNCPIPPPMQLNSGLTAPTSTPSTFSPGAFCIKTTDGQVHCTPPACGFGRKPGQGGSQGDQGGGADHRLPPSFGNVPPNQPSTTTPPH